MINKIQNLIDKYKELSDEMMNPNIMSNMKYYARIAKEHKSLESLVQKGEKYITLINQLDEYNEVLNGSDEELKELIKDDISTIKTDIEHLGSELKILLIPKDPNDDKNTILEIRSGTGGDEAALFAADLYRMYMMYSEKQNLNTEILSFHENEGGGNGVKE